MRSLESWTEYWRAKMLKKAVSDFEIDIHRTAKKKVFVGSRYEFLNAHKGIRPNGLHGLMGSTGSGKSTLIKCIIAEAAVQRKVLIWLSEETVTEYQEMINSLDSSVLENLYFVEEKEISEEFKLNQSDFFEYFEQMLEQSGCEIVFIDNVTTSAFYNQRYSLNGQMRAAEFLRDIPKRKSVAVFFVAHTHSAITDNYAKVINAEDIRGSKELPLNTEYLYILHKFTQNDKQYNIIRVAKYRHHEEAAGWYALKYEKGSYIGDSKIPFTLVNKIFKSRDFFGRSDKQASNSNPKPKAQQPDPGHTQLKLEDNNG
jgi:thymidylate kinase